MTMIVLVALLLGSAIYVDGQCGCSNQGKLLKRDANNMKLGDMYLDKADIMLISGFRAHYADTKRWPNKKVQYTFHSSFPGNMMGKVRECLTELQRDLKNCVTFQESGNGHHIEVRSFNEGCYSALGYTGSGTQPLNLQNPGCLYSKGTIKHEFIHALGFMHTHMRKDRDQHINIMWNNILTTHCSQFVLCTGCQDDGPYETNSVMHYPSYGFQCKQGVDTMIRRDGKKIDYNHETTGNDINMIKQFYGC